MLHVAVEGAFDVEETVVRFDNTQRDAVVCSAHEIDSTRYGTGYDDFGHYEQWVEDHCVRCGWLDPQPARF